MNTLGKVYSEGYCCLHGYLKLCQLRGESTTAMGANLAIPARTIRWHYQKLAEGKRPCENKSDCMKSLLAEIEKAP